MKRATKQAEPTIPAIPIDKEAQLVKELGAIITILDNMENDWEKRANAMRRLQGIAKGGSPRAFPAVFSEHFVKRFKEPICKQFGDLRSSLVKEAATCIETLSSELGDLIEPIIDPLVESIITMLGTTNKVLQAEGNRAMICILSVYKVNRSIAKICYFALTSKVSTQRQYSIDYIGRIIRSHKKYAVGFFDRNLDEIEKILKKALTDGIPSIRDLARSVFWDFYTVWEKRGIRVLESLDPNTKKNLLKDDPRPPKSKFAKTAQDDLGTVKQQKQTVQKGQTGQVTGQKFSVTDPALRLNGQQIGDDDNIDDLFFSTNPDIVGRRKEYGIQSKQQFGSPQKTKLSSPQKAKLTSPQKPKLSSPQKVKTSPQKPKLTPQKPKVKQQNNIYFVDDDEMAFEKPIDLNEDKKKKDLGRLSGMTASFSAVSFRRSTGYNTDVPDQIQSPPMSLQEQYEKETTERINAFKKLNECLKTQPEYELTNQLKDILDLIKSSLCEEDSNNTEANNEAIGRETLELVLTLIRKYHGYVVYNLDAILSPVFHFAVRHPMCNDICNSVMDATLASFSQDIVVPLAFRMLRSTVNEGNYNACLPVLTFILKAILTFPGYFHSVAKIKTYLPTLTTVAMAGNCASKATEILIRIFEGSKKDFVIAFLSFSPKEYKDMRESLPLIIPGLNEELESYGTERENDYGFMGNNASEPRTNTPIIRADSPKPKNKQNDLSDDLMLIEDKKEEPVVVISVKKHDDIIDDGNTSNVQGSEQKMTVEQQDTPSKENDQTNEKKSENREKENEMSTEEEEEEEEVRGEESSVPMNSAEETPKMGMIIEDEQPMKAMDDLVLPSSPLQYQQQDQQQGANKEQDEQMDGNATTLYNGETEKGDNSDNNDKSSEVSNTHSYSGESAVAATEKHSEPEEFNDRNINSQQHNIDIDADFDITSNPSIVEGINNNRNGGSSDVDSLLLDMDDEDDDDDDDDENDNNIINEFNVQSQIPPPSQQPQQQPQQQQSMATPLSQPGSLQQPALLLSPLQPQNKSLLSPPSQVMTSPLTTGVSKISPPKTNAKVPGQYQVQVSEDISLYLEDSEQPPRIKTIIGHILCSKTPQEYSDSLDELLRAVHEDKSTLSEQSTGAAISAVCARMGEGADTTELRDMSLKALCELLDLVPELIPLDGMRQAFIAATLVMDEYSTQITQGTIPMLRLSANVLVRMKSANLERYFQMLVGLCNSETTPRVLEAAIHNLSAFCSSVDKGFLTRQQGLILNSLIKPVNSSVAGVRKESTLCLAECCALLPDNQFFIEKLKTKLTAIQMRLVTYYYNEKMRF